MTILSGEALVNFLDLISDGASTHDASVAIGCSPKSKAVFGWLNSSEEASFPGVDPDPSSPWCVTWQNELHWFHEAYRKAQEAGREWRATHRSPLRADLEEKLAVKRAQMPERISVTPLRPVMLPPAPPPPVSHPSSPAPRPSYAFKRAPRLDGEDRPNGPPSEGRFTVSTRSYSLAERRGGKPEITDQGIKWH